MLYMNNVKLFPAKASIIDLTGRCSEDVNSLAATYRGRRYITQCKGWHLFVKRKIIFGLFWCKHGLAGMDTLFLSLGFVNWAFTPFFLLIRVSIRIPSFVKIQRLFFYIFFSFFIQYSTSYSFRRLEWLLIWIHERLILEPRNIFDTLFWGVFFRFLNNGQIKTGKEERLRKIPHSYHQCFAW